MKILLVFTFIMVIGVAVGLAGEEEQQDIKTECPSIIWEVTFPLIMFEQEKGWYVTLDAKGDRGEAIRITVYGESVQKAMRKAWEEFRQAKETLIEEGWSGSTFNFK